MSQSSDRKVEQEDFNRRIALADSWRFVARKIEQSESLGSIRIVKLVVKRQDRDDNPYKDDFFVVLSGERHQECLVKFRQFRRIEYLPHIVADMVRRESDWRPDRFR